ncbi:hypothetical protein GCM10027162_14150 [Streptomyces incanus]
MTAWGETGSGEEGSTERTEPTEILWTRTGPVEGHSRPHHATLPAHPSSTSECPTSYRTVIHEFALRVRVAGRQVARAQLRQILTRIEDGHATVRVIPTDQDDVADAEASMMHACGPVPRLDTALRDYPTGTAFIDAEPQLNQLRTLFRKVEKASLDPAASLDFIHRLTKEL